MKRREFVKGLGQASLVLAAFAARPASAAPAASAAVRLNGTLFNGTAGGEILASTDGGRSWRRTMFFGEDRPVQALSAKGGLLYAQVGVGALNFTVRSADGRRWLTSGAAGLRG